ncbi:hypothetical protein L226DRAFT_144066 [Lentinus tigrinus ALCF2SS1-7]|uniref:uncharacterized protein n=1 Tax=Lentinus tigrinus ALCF2SS1-7 TaxID=1328758 RepID=UPI001165F34F|nr:hypothetical protein L226DRAFT_144066 [Lentinus tigrinus ALCF2SS1-7]
MRKSDSMPTSRSMGNRDVLPDLRLRLQFKSQQPNGGHVTFESHALVRQMDAKRHRACALHINSSAGILMTPQVACSYPRDTFRASKPTYQFNPITFSFLSISHIELPGFQEPGLPRFERPSRFGSCGKANFGFPVPYKVAATVEFWVPLTSPS